MAISFPNFTNLAFFNAGWDEKIGVGILAFFWPFSKPFGMKKFGLGFWHFFGDFSTFSWSEKKILVSLSFSKHTAYNI